jgi:putative DNA primase/helicase
MTRFSQPGGPGGSHGPIDFAGLAAALLQRAETLVPQWLRDGKRRGHEWVCGDLSGAEGDSLSVNLVTGLWCDFQSGDKGGDLISLFAAIEGKNNGQAARELMAELGMQPVHAAGPVPPASRPQPVADAGPPQANVEAADTKAPRKSLWRAVTPVPPHAPAPDFKHWHYSEPEATWEYRFEGQLYGYVARFRTSTGGKEVMPFTWCMDESDGRGTQRWHWKQWEVPRPLFVPATVLSADLQLPVVLVEGEKCAGVGHALLPAEFDFVSWPGGGKAWDKAAWGWLMGRTVYLWADCDAKREALNKAEREAGIDPGTKPLLPEHRQPGMAAMVKIGAHLQAEVGCTVFICPLPKPGAVADGWDIADAAAQGWGAEEVRAFIRAALPFVLPEVAPGRAPAMEGGGSGISTPLIAGAGDGGSGRSWQDELLRVKGRIEACRDNVALALDGLPDRNLPGIDDAQGVIGYNEFTNNVVKLSPPPWGTGPGEWDEVDELEMGNWLVRKHWLPSMSRTTLEEGVAMVAKRHRFHPVRDRLDGLRGTWDGEKRLATWLQRACTKDTPEDTDAPLRDYLARVGTWLVMAICARVFTPGCKFDYMTIFEGPQGWGKSTLAKLLAMDWFADTGLVLGDKDSYQNLQGVLVYEWGELDALSRADVTKVKQFISSAKDRFRASFDRRAKDYPRQVVFIGTTNEDHYLVDPTGNRRMWPVRVTKRVDLDWVREVRDQLFAEALVYLDAGERFHPTHGEQQKLFDPQQQQRQIESAIQAAAMRFLYDEKQRVVGTAENGALIESISAPELLSKLGISVDKQTHVLLRQVTAALRQAGWLRYRSSRADRPWMFKRPEGRAGIEAGASGDSPPRPTQGPTAERADDDCPF